MNCRRGSRRSSSCPTRPAANSHRLHRNWGRLGLVPLVIERLSQRHPRLEFPVITADPVSLTAEELPRRNIELAIGAMPASPPADIETEHLFEDRQVIMAGINSPWVRRRKLILADLLHEPWVLPPPDSPARRYIDDAFLALGLEPPTAQVATFSMPCATSCWRRALSHSPSARGGPHGEAPACQATGRGVPRDCTFRRRHDAEEPHVESFRPIVYRMRPPDSGALVPPRSLNCVPMSINKKCAGEVRGPLEPFERESRVPRTAAIRTAI